MGSGKGRSRRAQTLVPTVAGPMELWEIAAIQRFRHVRWDGEKWLEFIGGSGVEKAKVYDYYLGDKLPQDCGLEDHQKVVSEFFKDVVSLEVLVLPKSCSVEDFELRITQEKVGGVGCLFLGMHLRRRPELETLWLPTQYHLTAETRMTDIEFQVLSLWFAQS